MRRKESGVAGQERPLFSVASVTQTPGEAEEPRREGKRTRTIKECVD